MGGKTRRGARLMAALTVAGLLTTFTGVVMMVTGGAASADPTPQPCVPADAWTEKTTVPALQPPDARPWRVVETVIVEDKAAYDEVVHVGWKNWVWHPQPGWEDPDDPLGPVWPDDEVKENGWWTSNEGNHEGHPQPPDPAINERGNYYRSHNENGVGDWFHWEELTETVHHNAVTHEAYLYALDHAAVVCEPTTPVTTPTDPQTTQATGPTETTTPPEVLPTTGTATPTEPEATQETEVTAEEQETQAPEVLGEQATAQPQLPTAVDAGQGWTMTQALGAALAATGLVMLVGAAATPRVLRRT